MASSAASQDEDVEDGSSGSRRGLAANCLGTAGTGCRKTDHCIPWNIPATPPKRKTPTTWTSQRPRKSRLSAPHLQPQLSRLADRTRLRRLKNTLLSKGAWQQVTRIEDLRHACLTLMALPLGRVRGGSVLTPHDYIATVQKRLGNRLWVGGGVSLLRFLPRPTVGTSRNLQHRRSHARTLRVQNPEGAPLRNPGGLIFSPPLLCPDVAPPWTFVWPLLLRLADTQRRRYLIANSRTTETKSWDSDNRAFNIARLDSGWATAPSRNSNALQSDRSADVRRNH